MGCGSSTDGGASPPGPPPVSTRGPRGSVAVSSGVGGRGSISGVSHPAPPVVSPADDAQAEKVRAAAVDIAYDMLREALGNDFARISDLVRGSGDQKRGRHQVTCLINL